MLNQIFMEKQEPQVQRATTEEGKTQQDIYIQEIAKKKKNTTLWRGAPLSSLRRKTCSRNLPN